MTGAFCLTNFATLPPIVRGGSLDRLPSERELFAGRDVAQDRGNVFLR